LAQIWRSRGRISAASEQEKDLALRTFGPNAAGDELPPSWLVETIERELPEFEPARKAGFGWERIGVCEGWRPDESVPHAHKAGCPVNLVRYEVIPPVRPSGGIRGDGRSMTAPALVGRPPSVMIRLGVCEACRHLLWGV